MDEINWLTIRCAARSAARVVMVAPALETITVGGHSPLNAGHAGHHQGRRQGSQRVGRDRLAGPQWPAQRC